MRINPAEPSLDDALDFFDDSGVLSDPEGRVGFVLADLKKVSAMVALNSAVDRAISVFGDE